MVRGRAWHQRKRCSLSLSLCQLNCYFFRGQIFVIAGRVSEQTEWLKESQGDWGRHQSWTDGLGVRVNGAISSAWQQKKGEGQQKRPQEGGWKAEIRGREVE